MIFRISIALIGIGLLFGCGGTAVTDKPTNLEGPKPAHISPPVQLAEAMQKVEKFYKPMGAPQQFDWLATFDEPGQTFEEYLNSDPTLPSKERSKIYVLPLGNFTGMQKKVIDITAGYLRVFYDLDVQMLPTQQIPQPLHVSDSRVNPYTHVEQVRTSFILEKILQPMLPPDAAALIAFTDDDLFPDNNMAFVFGQASMENRVGVWSLSRLDDQADFKTFLTRTIKIAAHETGHMFSIHHCRKYECVMNGSNHLGETDRHPLDACPECMAKICWLSKVSPAERYKRLADFCRKNGLSGDGEDFERKYAAVAND